MWFSLVHLGAFAGMGHLARDFHWQTSLLLIGFFFACQLAITMGNHRLFCHRAWKTYVVIEVILLVLIAATLQKSTIWWVWMHRRHHTYPDTALDPYSTTHGLYWAHILWVIYSSDDVALEEVKDLVEKPHVWLQHRLYYPLAIVSGLAVPTIIASAWGDALGGLLVGGFLRLAFQYHFTFSINSVTHWGADKPYGKTGTACVVRWLAIPTGGESNHQPHHIAEEDYRLGRRARDIDPGKWGIAGLEKMRLAWDLQRVSDVRFEARRARLENRALAAVA
jgi:stearoyl-CoA desaturase (delta-9 desaturase)